MSMKFCAAVLRPSVILDIWYELENKTIKESGQL